MWVTVGSFIGRALQTYVFYKKHPGLLELMSAPWYAELIIPLIGTAVLVILLIIIRAVLKAKDKEQ